MNIENDTEKLRKLKYMVTNKWAILTFYQRFESIVAYVLTLIITLVIVVAMYRLSISVFSKLVFDALNPLDHKVFQAVFGEILTVLIALEFNHTLQSVVTREQSIIQIKTVLLIAILALTRKFIITDIKETAPEELLGLAAVTLSLGVTYWLMHDRTKLEKTNLVHKGVDVTT
jgi:uncharacterized membrane protein (DUF373 family)